MIAKSKAKQVTIRKFPLNSSVLSQVHYLSNHLSATGNAHYRSRFGVSISEFRMMVVISSAPGLSGTRIHEITDLDKGAISRTLNALQKRGFVTNISNPRHPTYKHWFLTKSGSERHDLIASETRIREMTLLDGFSEAEREALLRFLRRMIENTPNLQRVNTQFGNQ